MKRPDHAIHSLIWHALIILATGIAGCAGPDQRDAELSRALTGGYRSGETVAVLLPETGRFAGAAQALKDGILAARGADAQDKRPELRFYDTSNSQSATALVRQAAADGARFVIGPLQKQAVEELARAADLPIPVLALNRISSSSKLPANLFQYSLAPEDEAADAAKKAWNAGHRSSLMLYPDSPWGNRIARGFSQQWAALGGRLTASEIYDPNQSDFTRPITKLSGGSGNADLLFLVATHQVAREIAPQIRTLSPYDLPIYSTSHIYRGSFDLQADQPLVGLYFVDIPWLVAPDPGDAVSRERLKRSIPGMKDSYIRLYAMGIDAYRLAPRLGWMASSRDAAMYGKTGQLRLDNQRNIVRQLTLATMKPSGPELAATNAHLREPPGQQALLDPVLAAQGTSGLAAVRR